MYYYDRLLIQVHKISSINEYQIFGLLYKKKKNEKGKYEICPVDRIDYLRLFGEKNAIKNAKRIAEEAHDELMYKEIVAVLFKDSEIGDVIWREE